MNRKLDIRDIIFYILAKWKMCVILMVICTVVLGVGQYNNWKEKQGNIEAYIKSVVGKDGYDEGDELPEQVMELFKTDELLEQYNRQILKLTALTADEVYQGKLIYHIDMQEIGEERANQITQYYAILLEGDNIYQLAMDDLVEQSGTEELGLEATTFCSLRGSLIQILFIAEDEETCESVLKAYDNCIKELQTEIASNFGKYSISLDLKEISKKCVDFTDGINSKTQRANSLRSFKNNCYSQLSEQDQALYSWIKTGSIFEDGEEPDTLQRFIFIPLGFFMGLLLTVIICSIYYCLTGKIQSVAELETYIQKDIINVTVDAKRRHGLSKVIYEKRYKYNNLINWKDQGASIKNYLQTYMEQNSKKSLLFIYNDEEDKAQMFVSDILTSLKDVNALHCMQAKINDIETRNQLAKADLVCLIETIGVSHVMTVEKEIKLIQECGTPQIMGVAIYQ